MDDPTVELLDTAQRRAFSLLAALAERAEPGMGSRDLLAAADELLAPWGFDRWASPPAVCLGRAARWPGSHGRVRLVTGDTLTLRLEPAAGDLRAHVGASLIVGAPPTALVAAARDCTRALCGYASSLKCVGELFIYARTWALTHGFELADKGHIGRALPQPGGLAVRLRSAGWLRRNQVHVLNPRRLTGPWVIGPTLVEGATTASFHEVVLVRPGLRRVLGRDGVEQVGTLLG
jgi:hypothetical protein